MQKQPTRPFSGSAKQRLTPQRAHNIVAAASDAVPLEKLLEVAERAAKAGAAVIAEKVDKPRDIEFKGATDLVTDTDKASEEAVLSVLREAFPDHALLGEEGGVSGDTSSDYLWCIDPLDGTTNYAHKYPSFGVSVAVLEKAEAVAGVVVEFAGGPGTWIQRTYTGAKGKGAYMNGQRIHVSQCKDVGMSLLVTGFGYDHDEAWAANVELFKQFTDASRGVRRLGAAAVDLCHTALGVVDGYWELRLKPWDMSAGVVIAREAGAKITQMDGKPFSPFSRSIVVANEGMLPNILEKTVPATKSLMEKGIDLSPWFVPEGYKV
ncbi:Phosphatase impl1, chloroplastic [Coccomyxa viridis]|uniref:Inositol-1-monophosphatase n=1 Tax=Coccomyxa viridis TaxID=1274662 RepID=A0AAV1HTP4_9CHLO|nr:Phosphatase impl1, chloroplastic [Coccomyxa viridis]